MAKTPKPVRRKNKQRRIALKYKGVFDEHISPVRVTFKGETYIVGSLTTFNWAYRGEEKR